MSSIEDLNPEQAEKYQQFVLITNWEKDPLLPLLYLRSTNWDLEVSYSKRDFEICDLS